MNCICQSYTSHGQDVVGPGGSEGISFVIKHALVADGGP